MTDNRDTDREIETLKAAVQFEADTLGCEIIRQRERANAAEARAASLTSQLEKLMEVVEAQADEVHRLMRAAEMSSGIMLDPKRTGNWAGARRTADAFDRIGLRAAEIKAALKAAVTSDPSTLTTGGAS